LHASAIYYLLENEIVPTFYERRDQTPREWIRRVKQSLMHISPSVDRRRMGREYMNELYDPAQPTPVRAGQYELRLSQEKARWNSRIREVWDRVRFVDAGGGPPGTVVSGMPVNVRTAIDLAGLTPDDVRVELVIGRVDNNGNLEDTEVMVLPAVEHQGGV